MTQTSDSGRRIARWLTNLAVVTCGYGAWVWLGRVGEPNQLAVLAFYGLAASVMLGCRAYLGGVDLAAWVRRVSRACRRGVDAGRSAVATLRPVARRATPAVVAVLMVTSTVGGLAIVGTQPLADGQSGTASAAAGDHILNVSTGGSVDGSPTIYNGTVYFGSNDKILYAVDTQTGAEKWSVLTGGQIGTAPTVANETVYVTPDDNSLYAYDAKTGNKKWNVSTGGSTSTSPTVANGTVYVTSGDGLLYAFDADTGSKQWTAPFYDSFGTAPTISNGTVYIGTGGSELYAFDAETGGKAWNASTDGSVYGAPTVANGTVYAGTFANTMYAVDASTGTVDWSQSTSNNLAYVPTVANGMVYAASGGSSMYAFNASTGSIAWTGSGSGSMYGAPTYAGNVVYVGSQDDSLYAFDADTGSLIWNVSTSGNILSAPTVADGTVFFGSKDNSLYAFDTSHSKSSSGSRNRLHTLGHVGGVYNSAGSPGADIIGTVTDPTGDGYGAATIDLINDSGTVVSSVSPYSNGTYEISGVSDGDYTLRVSSDEFDTLRRSVTVSGSSVTVDVQLGYRQTVTLKDPRGIFKPYDPKVTVYRWEGSQLATRSPGGPDWTRTQTRSISWDGDVQLGLADGEFYAFVLSVDHSEAAGGSAEATIFGFVGNSSNGAVTWDVSEPESASNSTVVAETSGNTARVVYDGPPVEELDYSVEGEGNSTLERNMSFDEPRSYYETQVRLNSSGTNLSEPESLSYSGVYANGSTFNGSASISSGNFSSFGPVSGGGGGSSGPLGPVIATTTLAGAGLLLYSRRSGQSLGELAGGAARSLGSVLGRRGR